MHVNDILLVDYDVDFIAEFRHVINAHYAMRHVPDEETAWQSIGEARPGLILYRSQRAATDDYVLCSYLKAYPKTADIPVIILSDTSDPEDKRKAFTAGAIDYLVGPFISLELEARVLSILSLQAARRKIEQQEADLQVQARELLQGKMMFLKGMAGLAETRDPETGDHLLRVQHYMKTLCRYLQQSHTSSNIFGGNDGEVADLCRAAILHDIGKVGVRDHVLLKEGPLTPEEFEEMKMHAFFGERIIKKLRRGPQKGNRFLRHAEHIAGGHHEHWDGTGYPRGLKCKAIPLSARLMAVADVYDSIISPRVYKPGRSHVYAVEFIMDQSGTQFDPELAQAFYSQHEVFNMIANRFT